MSVMEGIFSIGYSGTTNSALMALPSLTDTECVVPFFMVNKMVTICKMCGKEFDYRINNYGKRNHYKRKYCTLECYWEAIRKYPKGERPPQRHKGELTCPICKKTRIRWLVKKDEKIRVCFKCAHKARGGRVKGKDHPCWSGGKHMTNQGYPVVYIPRNHKFASMVSFGNNKQGAYMFEHRYVMAMHLNRILYPREVIHHINGDKTDNRVENLILVDTNNHPKSYSDAYEDGYKKGYNDAMTELTLNEFEAK